MPESIKQPAFHFARWAAVVIFYFVCIYLAAVTLFEIGRLEFVKSLGDFWGATLVACAVGVIFICGSAFMGWLFAPSGKRITAKVLWLVSYAPFTLLLLNLNMPLSGRLLTLAVTTAISLLCLWGMLAASRYDPA